MSSGVPLNDADREPWLKLIRKTAEETISRQQQDSESRQLDNKPRGIIVTCSALKRYYRDILRGTYQPPSSQNVDRLEHHIKTVGVGGRLRTLFVYIKGDENILRERMKQRQGHYMKPEMLDSQLAALESPEGEDEVVIVSLDNTTDGQVEETLRGLKGLGVFQ